MTSLRPSRVLPLLALLAATPSPAQAADEGEALFTSSCSSCHGPKSHPLDAVRLSREKWKEAVDKMERMGADVPSGKKLDVLLDWLVRTHGPGVPAPEAANPATGGEKKP